MIVEAKAGNESQDHHNCADDNPAIVKMLIDCLNKHCHEYPMNALLQVSLKINAIFYHYYLLLLSELKLRLPVVTRRY